MQTSLTDSGNEARTKAIRKFWTFYGLSLMAVGLISFFIFSTPGKVSRQDTKRSSELNRQHSMLGSKTEKISEQASDLVEVEKTKAANSDPTLEAIFQQRRKAFEQAVADLKSDSLDPSYSLVKNDLSTYLNAYNALNFYLDENRPMKNTLISISKTDTISEKADNTQLESQFAQLKSAYDLLLVQNAELKRKQTQSTTKPDPGTGSQPRITELENQLRDCKSQAAEDLRSRDQIIRNKEKEIDQLESQKSSQASDVDKAKFYFQKVDAVVERSKSNRKAVFDALKASLNDIRNSYPDKAALSRRIADLEQLSRGVVF